MRKLKQLYRNAVYYVRYFVGWLLHFSHKINDGYYNHTLPDWLGEICADYDGTDYDYTEPEAY